MPRDGSGNYTLPAGNPVLAGTIITPTWANPTMGDLGNEITDSLSRTGKGGMLVPFLNSDGTESNPGITWTNEASTGFYRAASQDMRASITATDSTRWITGFEGFEIWTALGWQKPILAGGDPVVVTGQWVFQNDVAFEQSVACALAITIPNNVSIVALEVDTTPKTILGMDTSDFVSVGNDGNPLTLRGTGYVFGTSPALISGTWTFAGVVGTEFQSGIRLSNDKAVIGDLFAGGTVDLLAIDASDVVQHGDVSVASQANGTWLFPEITTVGAEFRQSNNAAHQWRNAANDAWLNGVHLSSIDEFLFGAQTVNAISHALATHIFQINGVESCRVVDQATGSLMVRSRTNVERKAGFRNPGFNAQNGAYTITQNDEGQIVRKASGGAANYTVPQLEALTAVIVINADAADVITLVEGTGVTFSALVGDEILTGNLLIAHGSVIQLYWTSATTVDVWGNGISQ